jgi:hypothetical protein
VNGEIPLDDLVISKTLKADYKDPTKIAHKVLAERIGEREPGNKPQINDRIPYVYILPPPGVESKLQGDRIESPSFIRANNLKPDYRFYITNQIQKPVCQLYGLCVEKLKEYAYPPSFWSDLEERLSQDAHYHDEKKRKKRLTDLRMRMAEELLFEPYLAQLPDHKAKKRTMAQYIPSNDPKSTSKSKAKSTMPRVTLTSSEAAQAFHLEVHVAIDKDAGYKGFYTLSQTFGSESESMMVVHEDLTTPKRKNTKKDIEKLWLQKAFDTIASDAELYLKVKKYGMRLKVDVAIKRLINATLKNKADILNGNIYQQIQDAAKSTDVEVCNALSEEISCMFIVAFFNQVRFEFVP